MTHDRETQHHPGNGLVRGGPSSVDIATLSAMLGFLFAMTMAFVIERIWGEQYLAGPHISYGQTFAFITLPLCTVLGAVTGVLSLSVRKQNFGPLAATCLLICLIVMASSGEMWSRDVRDNGRDLSQTVLFLPVLSISFIGCCVGAWAWRKSNGAGLFDS